MPPKIRKSTLIALKAKEKTLKNAGRVKMCCKIEKELKKCPVQSKQA